MKKLLASLLLFLILGQVDAQKRTYIRVYDEVGKKIFRGFIQRVSDSSLTILDGSKKTVEVPASMITSLRLKRSFGHTVLITSLIAGGTMAIMGAASADPDAWIFAYGAAEGALMGLVAGGVSGAALGSIISGTQKRPIFKIDRNPENWKKAKLILERYILAEEKPLLAIHPVNL
jgi:hypothetical protein